MMKQLQEEASAEFKQSDVLYVIQQYLVSNGFPKSALCLVEESNNDRFFLDGGESEDFSHLRRLVFSGKWAEVQEFLSPVLNEASIELQRRIQVSCHKQHYLELISSASTDGGLAIEQVLTSLRLLVSPSDFSELCYLLGLDDIKNHPSFSSWSTSSGRISVLKELVTAFKSVIPIQNNIVPFDAEKPLEDLLPKKHNIIISEKNVTISKEKNLILPNTSVTQSLNNFRIKHGGFNLREALNDTKLIITNTSNLTQDSKLTTEPPPIPVDKESCSTEEIVEVVPLQEESSSESTEEEQSQNDDKSATVYSKPLALAVKHCTKAEKSKIKQPSMIPILPTSKAIKRRSNTQQQSTPPYDPSLLKDISITTPRTEETTKPLTARGENCNQSSEQDSGGAGMMISLDEATAAPVGENPKTTSSSPKQESNDSRVVIIPPPLAFDIPLSNNDNKAKEAQEKDYEVQPQEEDDNLMSYNVVASVTEKQAIRIGTFNPTGTMLAIGTNSKDLKLYDTDELKLLDERRKHHAGSIYTAAWSSDSTLIATGSNDKCVRIQQVGRNTFNSSDPIVLKGHSGIVRQVCFKGNLLCSAGAGDFIIRVWDIESMDTNNSTTLMELDGHSKSINAMITDDDTSSSSSSMIVTGSSDESIRLWDVRTGCCERVIKGVSGSGSSSKNSIQALSLSDRVLSAGLASGDVSFWDLRMSSGRKSFITSVSLHQDEVRALAFENDLLLSGSFDKSVCISRVSRNNVSPVSEFNLHSDKVLSVQWHPKATSEGEMFMSTGADCHVKLWKKELMVL